MNDEKERIRHNELFWDIAESKGYTFEKVDKLMTKLNVLKYGIIMDNCYTPVFIYNYKKGEVVHKLHWENPVKDVFDFMDKHYIL